MALVEVDFMGAPDSSWFECGPTLSRNPKKRQSIWIIKPASQTNGVRDYDYLPEVLSSMRLNIEAPIIFPDARRVLAAFSSLDTY